MATKRPVRRTTSIDVPASMKDYLQNRSLRERSEREEKNLKIKLMSYMESHSDELETEPIPFVSYAKGAPTEKKIIGARRSRRRSKVLIEEKAMALIAKHGLEETCLATVTIVDEDGILGANFEGVIDDKELAAIYEERDTYAFNLIEE